jgi:hypothetical protein
MPAASRSERELSFRALGRLSGKIRSTNLEMNLKNKSLVLHFSKPGFPKFLHLSLQVDPLDGKGFSILGFKSQAPYVRISLKMHPSFYSTMEFY